MSQNESSELNHSMSTLNLSDKKAVKCETKRENGKRFESENGDKCRAKSEFQNKCELKNDNKCKKSNETYSVAIRRKPIIENEVFHDKVFKEIVDSFINDMNNFGIAVIDSFLGTEKGNLVYEEVINLHQSGLFKEGELVRNNMRNNRIRGDEIIWLDGNENDCPNIKELMENIDCFLVTAFKLPSNGKLKDYRITGRTRAMVACYPGNGAHYVKHVDNPHGDGRIITAIYYLNKDWQSQKDGGILRIYPVDEKSHAAEITPMFDRMLFFWSDRRNPHEVQPSFRTRYAITMWYFDEGKKQSTMHEQIL